MARFPIETQSKSDLHFRAEFGNGAGADACADAHADADMEAVEWKARAPRSSPACARSSVVALALAAAMSALGLIGGCALMNPTEVRASENSSILLDEREPEQAATPALAGLFEGVWVYEQLAPEELLQFEESTEAGNPDADQETQNAARDDGSPASPPIVERARTRALRSNGDMPRWESTLGPERSEIIALNEAGDLVLLETTDRAHDARTVFDPPLVLIHAEHEPGRVYAQQSRATVWSLRDPDRRQDEGEVAFEVEYDAQQRVNTPATGEVDAHRFRASQSIDFARADVFTRSTVWYVEEFGPVLFLEFERIKMFGPLGWTTEIALQLRELNRPTNSNGDDGDSP